MLKKRFKTKYKRKKLESWTYKRVYDINFHLKC